MFVFFEAETRSTYIGHAIVRKNERNFGLGPKTVRMSCAIVRKNERKFWFGAKVIKFTNWFTRQEFHCMPKPPENIENDEGGS